ncbi:hypothetical protein ABT354_10645 [Streptomyces sp. NPDC000594]|uniref:hypothetical protein n=1 Tax=Streptomyces sp. NPDC000594 TaxID=3154261 RepID=UPI00331768C7
MAPPRRTDPVRALALALALVAAGWAGWSGWRWYTAAHDEPAAYAAERDRALAAGEQAILNLNTLDHRNLTRGLDTWEDSATGELRRQLTDGRAEFERQIQRARTVSSARLLAGAVTELDTRAGRASVMVSLRVTVTAPKSEPVRKESRMLGELTRTGDGWKLSGLGQPPVGAAGPADRP